LQCSAVEEAEARRRGVCERIRVTAGSKLRGAATRCRHSRRRSARHQTRTQLSRHTLRSLYYSLSLSLSLSVYLSFTRCQLPLATFTAFFCRQNAIFRSPKSANFVKNFATNPEFRQFRQILSKNQCFVTTASFRHFVSFSSKRNPLEPIYTHSARFCVSVRECTAGAADIFFWSNSFYGIRIKKKSKQQKYDT